jgi:hypothetical protein
MNADQVQNAFNPSHRRLCPHKSSTASACGSYTHASHDSDLVPPDSDMRITYRVAHACADISARRRSDPGTTCHMDASYTSRVRCSSVDAVGRVGFTSDVYFRATTTSHLLLRSHASSPEPPLARSPTNPSRSLLSSQSLAYSSNNRNV